MLATIPGNFYDLLFYKVLLDECLFKAFVFKAE